MSTLEMASSTTPAPVHQATLWTAEWVALVRRSPAAGAQEVEDLKSKVIEPPQDFLLVDQLTIGTYHNWRRRQEPPPVRRAMVPGGDRAAQGGQ